MRVAKIRLQVKAIGHATSHAMSQRIPKPPEIPVLIAVMKHVMKNDMTHDIKTEKTKFACLTGICISREVFNAASMGRVIDKNMLCPWRGYCTGGDQYHIETQLSAKQLLHVERKRS